MLLRHTYISLHLSDKHIGFGTGTEFSIPIFFWYRIDTHFLAFSVPVPVWYDTSILTNFTFKYRYRTEHFRYRYPSLASSGIGIFGTSTRYRAHPYYILIQTLFKIGL
ncbi:hypothetical protein Hanom_Chr09g00849581 [Helianthus anomalus]